MTKPSPPHVDVAIAALAARQYGDVSLKQLVALGLSPSAVRMRVQRGRLHVVRRGVYSLSPVLGRGAREMAAVLASDGVLSFRSGADWLGIRTTTRPVIEISVPRGRRLALPGIQVHEQRRTESAVERVLAASNGRRGAPILASLLADFEPVNSSTKIEELFRALCPIAPEEQYWIDGYCVDFAWPEYRLIAETDGWETHGTRTAFEKDRERLQELVARGWRVVSFTYRQITKDPDRVRQVLRRLLTP